MDRFAVGPKIVDFPPFEQFYNFLHGVVLGFAGAVVFSADEFTFIVYFARADSALHRFGRSGRDDEVAGRGRVGRSIRGQKSVRAILGYRGFG